MTQLRVWRRQHTTDDISEVSPVEGLATWTACVWWAAGNRTETIPARFALLMHAQDAADRLALGLSPHDCAGCEQWQPLERRLIPRPLRKQAN